VSSFSKRTLRLLGDEFAGSWTLRTIEIVFDDADIARGPESAGANESGMRRALMCQYLSTLDLDNPADTHRLAQVVSDVLADIRRRLPESQEWYDRWLSYLRRDGFSVDAESGRILTRRAALTEHALSALPDASAIHDHLRRLGDNIDTDPRLAVSVAKDLVESTAKLVLRERGVSYGPGDTVPQLVARAQGSLRLAAKEAKGQTSEEERALKAILGSLVNLAQGVTELRNKVGVGHGRESVPAWVAPRHARLAAGAAQVWCQLMLETLDDPNAPWRSGHPSLKGVGAPA
jgi:hypothetical protein